MVNKFARLNIQHLGVNTFMYCNALSVTMHLVVLHVPGYSSSAVPNLAEPLLESISMAEPLRPTLCLTS